VKIQAEVPTLKSINTRHPQMFHLLIISLRRKGTFSITRGITKFPWTKQEFSLYSHVCDRISLFSTIRLQYNRISRKASATQFFSSSIQRSIDLLAPSDAQRFVRKPLLFDDLLPSRWSRCMSSRRPFRFYNFLFEEINFQLSRYNSIQSLSMTLPFAILVRGIRISFERTFVIRCRGWCTQDFDPLRKELILRWSIVNSMVSLMWDILMRLSGIEVEKKSLPKHRCLACYFCLSVPFAIFTWKSGASRDAKPRGCDVTSFLFLT